MSEMVGQSNAFRFDIDEAVRQYADMVYRLAELNTDSEQDAEDAFQEVFLKLFRHKDSIQSEEHLKAWLIRVTINQCRSMVSSAWNKRRVSLDVEALVPGAAVIKSDIRVMMENDSVISDECTLTCSAEGNPLILRLSGTQDILPGELTQVQPTDVDGLAVYAAVSQSGKSCMAGFRQDGFSFFLMGSNMDKEQFEILLGELIENIQK